MELLEYLKSNISINKSLDEIINVFEEMCKTPIEEDLLLSEYGVYDFTGEDLFYYDLVRQYPDGEDEYFQLRVSIMFSPDEENRFLQDTLWSDDSDENFFDYIKKSDGYAYAKVVATGGLGNIIVPETDVIDIYDPMLTLEGLRMIYEKYKKAEK